MTVARKMRSGRPVVGSCPSTKPLRATDSRAPDPSAVNSSWSTSSMHCATTSL